MIYKILLIQSIVIAAFSYVYIVILFDSDKLLGPVYGFLKPIMDKTLITRWIAKPLLDCVHCNAGQIALWFYLVTYWNNYDLLTHIGFISITILIVSYFHKKLK